MKTIYACVTGLMLLAAAVPAVPMASSRGNPLDQGNDNCPALIIPSLPFTDTGTTAGRADNFAPEAACGPSNAPDVVYQYTAAHTGLQVVSLCGSSYDTYLYVRAGECPGGFQIACNDDYCGVQSEVMFNGITSQVYTIVVDGHGSSSGAYTLHVTDTCYVPCRPGDIAECTEIPGPGFFAVDCDGGCNNPYYGGVASFQTLLCGETVCGQGFTYDNSRDTDWYEFTLAGPCTVRVTAVAEFPLELLLFQAQCPSDPVGQSMGPDCGVSGIFTGGALPAGSYYLWAGPAVQSGIDVPRRYRATLQCFPAASPVPAAPGNLVIRCAPNVLELNWQAVTQDTSGNPITVDHYVVYASTDAAAWDSIGVPNPPDATVFDTADISAARRYFQVRAVAQ